MTCIFDQTFARRVQEGNKMLLILDVGDDVTPIPVQLDGELPLTSFTMEEDSGARLYMRA